MGPEEVALWAGGGEEGGAGCLEPSSDRQWGGDRGCRGLRGAEGGAVLMTLGQWAGCDDRAQTAIRHSGTGNIL